MSGGDTEQSPPPPPPPRTGSPFGRFLTSPVLLVGAVALLVGFTTLRFVGSDGGGGENPAGQAPGIDGSWGTLPSAGREEPAVRMEVDRSGGVLTRGRCSGVLTPRQTESDDRWVFAYEHESGGRRCPRRMRVTLSLVDDNTLRITARRGGREYVSGTLIRGR